MIDFSVSPEQLSYKNKAREFARAHILTRDDLDTHGHFPLDLYQKAFSEGFVTGNLPEEYGGGGRSSFESLLAAEEFAYGDLGVATSTFLLKLATGPLLGFGTEDQKNRWLKPLSQKLTFASYAWSEPEGSSNLMGRPASTTYRTVQGGFLLNGIKSTISNAGVASMFTVFARNESEQGGLSCFLVSRKTNGIEVSNPYKKMGQRAGDTGQITFKDVFVPSMDQIGQAGQGLQIGMRSIRGSRVGIAAMAVGVARRACDLIKIYGHTHYSGDGSLLIQQQDFRLQIAQIEAEIEMVRSLTWRACWEVENGEEATKLSSCAKLIGADMAVRTTNKASEMLGALGYLESGMAEKLIRDSKVLQIYEGTATIQKILIADTATRLGSLAKNELSKNERPKK